MAFCKISTDWSNGQEFVEEHLRVMAVEIGMKRMQFNQLLRHTTHLLTLAAAYAILVAMPGRAAEFDNGQFSFMKDIFRKIIVLTALIVGYPGGVFAEDLDPFAIAIPESSKGPVVPLEKGYLVEEIRDGIYWVTNGVYQSMFMTTGHGIVVVDAPPSIGQNLLRAIRDVSEEPITHMVYSHSHKDHIGAAGLLPKQIEIIAHEEVKEILTNAKDPNRPLPTVVFNKKYQLTVGNKTLYLSYPGEGHSSGNIFIYAQKQKILMLVDVVFPGWVPFANLGMADDVKGIRRILDQSLDYDFDTLIGGHVTRLGNRRDVILLKQYVDDLDKHAAQARNEIEFSEIAEENGGYSHMWHLYNLYYEKVAKRCAELTIPKYLDTLADVASYTEQNCFWMNMSDEME